SRQRSAYQEPCRTHQRALFEVSWAPGMLSNAIGRAIDRPLPWLTTSLRYELNQVVKEFVTAKGQPGTLSLSDLAGCAVQSPQAVPTNKYCSHDLDCAFNRAIGMPKVEAQM